MLFFESSHSSILKVESEEKVKSFLKKSIHLKKAVSHLRQNRLSHTKR